jgi:hypothetical protein
VLKKAVEGADNLRGIVITVPTGRPPLTEAEKVKMLNGGQTEHIRYVDLDLIKKYGSELGLFLKKHKDVGQGWVSLVATLSK